MLLSDDVIAEVGLATTSPIRARVLLFATELAYLRHILVIRDTLSLIATDARHFSFGMTETLTTRIVAALSGLEPDGRRPSA